MDDELTKSILIEKMERLEKQITNVIEIESILHTHLRSVIDDIDEMKRMLKQHRKN